MDFLENELYHHGILGQKWGVRRYQNSDGSLTPAGKKRYLNPDGTMNARGKRTWFKTNQTSIINKEIELENEFDKTEKGKKLKQDFQKAQSKYYGRPNESNYDETDEPDEIRSYKDYKRVAMKYMGNRSAYAGKKLLDEYSPEEMSVYLAYGADVPIKNVDQIVHDFYERGRLHLD